MWKSLGKHKHYQYNSGTVQSSSTFAFLGAPVWHQAVKPRDGRLLETSLLRLPSNPLLPDPDPSIWKFYLYKNVEFRCWGGQGHQLFQNMENYFQFIVALYIFPHSCHPGLNKAWKTMDCLNALHKDSACRNIVTSFTPCMNMPCQQQIWNLLKALGRLMDGIQRKLQPRN